MKYDSTLNEVRRKMDEIENNRRDFVADRSRVWVDPDDPTTFCMTTPDNPYARFHMTESMHESLAHRIGIPQMYYNRCMRKEPELLSTQVNRWLGKSEHEAHIIRTVGDKARAILSPSYRIIDSHVLMSAYNVLADEMMIDESNVGASFDLEGLIIQTTTGNGLSVVPGDDLNFGFTMTTSEVGRGAEEICPMVMRLVCSNGLIVWGKSEDGMRRIHKGQKYDPQGGVIEITQDSRRDDLDYQYRDQLVAKMRKQARGGGIEIARELQKTAKKYIALPANENELDDYFKRIRNKTGLTAEEMIPVRETMLGESNPSLWSLINSVTAVANQVESQSRSIQIQRGAWKLLNEREHVISYN